MDDDLMEILWTAIALAMVIGFCLWLASCTSTPSCRDNPRNMQCMTPAQLEKELNQ